MLKNSLSKSDDITAGGSVIVRKSGTEPLIKVRVEAENPEVVKLAADKIITKISEFM